MGVKDGCNRRLEVTTRSDILYLFSQGNFIFVRKFVVSLAIINFVLIVVFLLKLLCSYGFSLYKMVVGTCVWHFFGKKVYCHLLENSTHFLINNQEMVWKCLQILIVHGLVCALKILIHQLFIVFFFRQQCYKCVLDSLQRLLVMKTSPLQSPGLPTQPGPPPAPDPNAMTPLEADKLVCFKFTFFPSDLSS